MPIGNDHTHGIALMYEIYGTTAGRTCMECDNLVLQRGEDRVLKRCGVYLAAKNEPEDWQIRWKACGMFDKKPMKADLMRLAYKRRDAGSQIEGQIEMGGESR